MGGGAARRYTSGMKLPPPSCPATGVCWRCADCPLALHLLVLELAAHRSPGPLATAAGAAGLAPADWRRTRTAAASDRERRRRSAPPAPRRPPPRPSRTGALFPPAPGHGLSAGLTSAGCRSRPCQMPGRYRVRMPEMPGRYLSYALPPGARRYELQLQGRPAGQTPPRLAQRRRTATRSKSTACWGACPAAKAGGDAGIAPRRQRNAGRPRLRPASMRRRAEVKIRGRCQRAGPIGMQDRASVLMQLAGIGLAEPTRSQVRSEIVVAGADGAGIAATR
jgi:hypothetical protein